MVLAPRLQYARAVHRFTPLPRDFAARDTVDVARSMLGQVLVHATSSGVRAGRIVEVEAYVGPHDLACHASKGRTPRTEVMFGPPGHAYVFLVYGMHHCFNVVTGGGAAVLVRALAPLDDADARLMAGPGKLTAALRLTLRHNRLALDAPPVFLAEGEPVPPRHIASGPRIGVDYAGAWARKKLRFWEKGSKSVSR